jgi:hypothetical protein
VIDRLRSWRPPRPTSRVGARRAGWTVVAVLVVTAALKLLLAFHYHQPLQPVVVSILGTLPALYLAYAAVPIDR